MVDSLEQAFKRAQERPCLRLFPGEEKGCEPTQAAESLLLWESRDRQMASMAYGLGLDIGVISFALHVEPALITFRLALALKNSAEQLGVPVEQLEEGITRLFREDTAEDSKVSPPPEEEGDTWQAIPYGTHYPEAVRQRLEARLIHDVDVLMEESGRAGLGIGSIAFLVIAILAFLAYGVIRDENPLMRGNYFMRHALYDKALPIFEDYARISGSDEARIKIILCLLAEGRFSDVLERFDDAQFSTLLKDFGPEYRPGESPLEPVSAPDGCRALLPRGTILNPRPTFVIEPGPANPLRINLVSDAENPLSGPMRSIALQDTSLEDAPISISYPKAFGRIPHSEEAVTLAWQVDSESHVTFTVMPPAEADRLRNFVHDRLSRVGAPPSARRFLAGHLYLQRNLYQPAAELFAEVARDFPDEPYPKEVVHEIAAALRVDPSLFLR